MKPAPRLLSVALRLTSASARLLAIATALTSGGFAAAGLSELVVTPAADKASSPGAVIPAEHESPLDAPAIAASVPLAPFWLAEAPPTDTVPSDARPAAGSERPSALFRPLDPNEALREPLVPEAPFAGLLFLEREPPLGFSGPSGVLPTEHATSPHFVPIEDRWRIGFPTWDRYGQGQPRGVDYPYEHGRLLDPYNQNVLKGDYPIVGEHTFLNITATSFSINEYRQTPTGTTPFESTVNPFQEEFFGDPNQYFLNHNLSVSLDLFHGNAAFKPADWRLRVDPIFNVNVLDVNELGVVYPDVRRGTRRTRSDFALEQWFAEYKLADLWPDYDFASLRAGSQPFVSDFRGFVFRDVNRGVRLFGTRFANRDQFNAIWFDQTEKDTNSMLNTFDDRNQNTVIVNYFRQDFVFPGFTGLLNFHYNNDQPDVKFDDNGFLVRPDPAGVFRPHRVEAYYLGVGADGHIGRVNISTQFYQALGRDSLNPIANCPQDINAQMAAMELSVDRDWIRFRTSYFFASGDDDPNDHDAEGFDAILENPIFAGGEFSYWQRQQIRLFGVNLKQRQSLVPDLSSSKIQGQSNFVNPGLHLVNFGMDFEITPKLRSVCNANYLWFADTATLETFTFQSEIADEIGADLSVGMEWRPLLSDNIIVAAGYAILIPGAGFDDLFGITDPFTLTNAQQRRAEADAMNAAFVELTLTY